MVNRRHKKLDWLISRVPISIFVLSTLFNLYYIHIHDIQESSCQIGSEKILYLANELEKTIYIAGLFFIVIRLKLCTYNWVSVIGLAATNVFNIYAILFPVDYGFYTNFFLTGIIGSLSFIALLLFVKVGGKVYTNLKQEEK